MGTTIYKYELKLDELTRMPEGARLLSVQVQGTVPCVWAEVNPSHLVVDRDIRIYGTGHPLPDQIEEIAVFLGTFQLGPLVFHAYDAGEC